MKTNKVQQHIYNSINERLRTKDGLTGNMADSNEERLFELINLIRDLK